MVEYMEYIVILNTESISTLNQLIGELIYMLPYIQIYLYINSNIMCILMRIYGTRHFLLLSTGVYHTRGVLWPNLKTRHGGNQVKLTDLTMEESSTGFSRSGGVGACKAIMNYKPHSNTCNL